MFICSSLLWGLGSMDALSLTGSLRSRFSSKQSYTTHQRIVSKSKSYSVQKDLSYLYCLACKIYSSHLSPELQASCLKWSLQVIVNTYLHIALSLYALLSTSDAGWSNTLVFASFLSLPPHHRKSAVGISTLDNGLSSSGGKDTLDSVLGVFW